MYCARCFGCDIVSGEEVVKKRRKKTRYVGDCNQCNVSDML